MSFAHIHLGPSAVNLIDDTFILSDSSMLLLLLFQTTATLLVMLLLENVPDNISRKVCFDMISMSYIAISTFV